MNRSSNHPLRLALDDCGLRRICSAGDPRHRVIQGSCAPEHMHVMATGGTGCWETDVLKAGSGCSAGAECIESLLGSKVACR
jgi:hypothetical protein